ncbi:MAG: hypothetical protein H7X80_11195, partial [bacterium]|nr:hypothetical protein [Candidatus Kapabacteria bacterium]
MKKRPACRRLFFALVTIAFATHTIVHCQVPDLPDSLYRQHIVARSERFASTHTTSLAADYFAESLRARGSVRTYILSTTSLVEGATTKDQIDAVVDLEYLVPGTMRLMLLTEGTLTNDVRNNLTTIPGINNTAATFAGVGLRFVSDEGNRAGIAFGGAYNRQLNVEDAGLAVYGEVAAESEMADYRVRVDGTGRWQNLSPRQIGNATARMHIDREYDEGGYLSIDATLDATTTDLYLKRSDLDVIQFGGPSFDALQSRAETRVRVSPQLRYPVADDMTFELSATVATVAVGQQESQDGLPPLPRDPIPFYFGRSDLEMGAIVGARYNPDGFLFDARMEYLVREQRNIVDPVGDANDAELRRRRETSAANDFVSSQVLITSSSEIYLSRRDTVGAQASASIYRYDTPSRTNNFDRDEQVIQAQLRYARGFSPYLGFSIAGQIYLTHIVYLLGENSNDNNWNRVFRVVPAVRFELPDLLLNRFEAEVLANYTDYDFEGRTQNIRGRSYREIRLRDSLDLIVTRTLGFNARGELRISERGSFSWDLFAESLIERTRTEGLEAEAVTTVLDGLLFGAGGRLARAKSFRRATSGVLEPFSDITSV